MSEHEPGRRTFLLGLSAAAVTGAGLGLPTRLAPVVGTTGAAYLDTAYARSASLGVVAVAPFVPGLSKNSRMVDTGLGLGTDGHVYMWGLTSLGIGGGVAGAGAGRAPQLVPGLPDGMRQVTGQIYDANALDSGGTVWGWGVNDGRNGTDAARPAQAPKQVRIGTAWNGAGAILDQVVTVSSTEQAGAAIRSDGTIHHWGGSTGYGGNSGAGSSRLIGLPDPTVAGNRPVYLKGSYTNFFVILQNGDVWYWGGTGGSSLPPGVNNVDSAPALLSALSPWMKKNVAAGSPYVTAVDGGINLGAAILSDGRVLSWGSNSSRTGRGAGNAPALIPAASLGNVVSMQFSYTGALFLTGAGDLYGYGASDDYGNNPQLPVRLAQGVAQYASGQGYYLWQVGTGASATFFGRGYNPQGAIGLPTSNVGNQATAATDSRPVAFAGQTPVTLTPVRI